MVRNRPPTEWQQWVDWLAAGFHERNRWRLSLVIMGILFDRERRTVTTWLREVGIHDEFADDCYFVQPLGRNTKQLAQRFLTLLLVRLETGDRVLFAVDDSSTKGHGWKKFFYTDPDATACEVVEAFADRAFIEQNFHEVKEVWHAGQQQVRNTWTNIAAFNLNLWVHMPVECRAWNKPAEEIRDREHSPWDNAERRPSHADRCKALRRETRRNEYLSLSPWHCRSSRIRALYQRLLELAA